MTSTTQRATIRQDNNEVVLAYTTSAGDRIERRFWAPPSGGYVREVSDRRPGTLGDQVCTKLARRGATLSVATPDQLLALIRREWRGARGQ